MHPNRSISDEMAAVIARAKRINKIDEDIN
jgi:hypothetical protein